MKGINKSKTGKERKLNGFLGFRVAGNSVLNLKEIDVSKKSRFDDLKKSAIVINDLIMKNQELFGINMDSEKSVKAWYCYLLYVDEIVYKSILQMIGTSLSYILDETDTKNNPLPLFDLKIALSDPDIIFQPSIEKTIVGNFFDLTTGIIESIFEMSKLIPKIAYREEFPTYLGIDPFPSSLLLGVLKNAFVLLFQNKYHSIMNKER